MRPRGIALAAVASIGLIAAGARTLAKLPHLSHLTHAHSRCCSLHLQSPPLPPWRWAARCCSPRWRSWTRAWPARRRR
jgi:hypothetical protein